MRRPSYLVALFAAAVCVRVLYWLFVTPDWVPKADADQYVLLARALADGDGFQLVFPQLELHPTAFRPPLYPLALTPGFLLAPEALWPARLLTLLLGSTAVIQAAQLTERLASRRAAIIAGALLAFYPALVANDTVTLTEPLATVLLLGALLELDRERWARAALATGLLCLTRPNAYGVVAVLVFFIFTRIGRREALLFLGVVIAVVAPWVVRNTIQVDTPRLVTSDGFTMAAIYAPEAQEEKTFVDPVFSPRFDDPDLRFSQFDEAVWNDRLISLALDGVRDNPSYVAETAWRNLQAFVELDPERNKWAEDNDGRNLEFRDATLPLFFIVTPVGLYGVGQLARNRRSWPLLCVVAQYSVISILLVAPPRLRAPLDLLCCIGVGVVVDHVMARRSSSAPLVDDGLAAASTTSAGD